MRFTVTISPSAGNDLARIYNDAGADARLVADAANDIDRELKDDAHLKGRPWFGDRIIRIGLLLAFYVVSVDDRRADLLRYVRVPPSPGA